MSWATFWILFRLSLVAACVAGFIFPAYAQGVAGLVLFWLIFGPPKRKAPK